MTLIVMINADLLWTLRVYHDHLRHQRSIVFVVYFLRVTMIDSGSYATNSLNRKKKPLYEVRHHCLYS